MALATINWNGAPGSTPDANSCLITYAAGDVLYDSTNINTFPAGSFAAALNSFLTSHGYTFIVNTHTTGGGTAGRYAYSAPNLLDSGGTASAKYILLDFTVSGFLYVRVYESIVAGNTSPTNLTLFSDTHGQKMSATTAGVTSASGKLWFSVSARHGVMLGFSGGVYGNQVATYGDGGPTGWFELTRPNAYDTVAVNCTKYAFFSSGIFGYSSAFQHCGFTPYRVRGGANLAAGAISTYGSGGQICGNTTIPSGHMPANINADLSMPVCSNISLQSSNGTSANTESLGAVINCVALTHGYDIHIGKDIQIPTTADANYGNERFYDPAGTPTSMWLMGGNAGSLVRIAVPR